MSETGKQRKKRNFGSSGISIVIGISLVLFMLGLLGLIILNAKELSDYAKENIGFSVYLNKNVKEVDILQIRKSLDAEIYVKSTEYIDEKKAVEILQESLGPEEDFMSFLEHNPLLASIEVKLNAAYAHPDSLNKYEATLLQNPKIHEVDIRKDLAVLINENVQQISLVIMGFSLLLLVIAIALINNTIRLAIYSKRFLIKTMQLVGATPLFITRPYVASAILKGLVSSIIAIGLLVGVLYTIRTNIPDLVEIQNLQMYVSLFSIVVILGILISWISTRIAVRKYLRAETEKLY